MQTSLFPMVSRPVATTHWFDGFDADETDRHGLRYYQREAADAAQATFIDHETALLVLATGTGKTQIFCSVALETRGRVLVLCHRKELVKQAAERLEQMTGETIGEQISIEQASRRASKHAKYVVASVQTITQPKRLETWDPAHFDLVIFDEAHRILAPTWGRVVKYFKHAKLLGATATPDRRDGKKLAEYFDEVAYVFDIAEAIDAGYLVPLRGKRAEIETLDLDAVPESMGDLQEGALDEAIANETEGIVREVLRLEPNRCAIWFFPGKLSAELACKRLNALHEGSAVSVTDDTPDLDRQRNLFDFKMGRVQHLCACLVPTEGFDAPRTEMVVIARPTKSRALYAQMVGRSTRPVCPAIDLLPGPELAASRRRAIAASSKPDAVIMDVAGNSGKHALVTPEDILGSAYSDAEVREAKVIAKKKPGANVQDILREAREALKKLEEKLKRRGYKSTVTEFDPFAVFGTPFKRENPNSAFAIPATEKQQAALLKWGVPQDTVLTLTKRDASKLLGECFRRKDAGLASFGQLRKLQQFGVVEKNITRKRASEALDYLASTGWGKYGVDAGRLDTILNAPREAGEDDE